MARKKKLEPQTLNEFRAWLEGVEELQADKWSPTREQWVKIRTRIENIVEEEYEEYEQPAIPLGPIPRQQNPLQIQPSVFEAPAVLPQPQVPIVAPPQIPQNVPVAASAMPERPDLDTSSGDYKSEFE